MLYGMWYNSISQGKWWLSLYWERYCIPLDDDRPIAYAENQFFSESGTGKGNNNTEILGKYSLIICIVPVIVVFTKCESLLIKAIEALEDQEYDYDDAVENAQKYVDENLKNVHKVLEGKTYPPKDYVYLQG